MNMNVFGVVGSCITCELLMSIYDMCDSWQLVVSGTKNKSNGYIFASYDY